MRHYRRHHSGGERVKKIMFRILFVLIAAAIITFSTILLGNHLQRKVDALDNSAETTPPQTHNDISYTNGDFYDSPTVFGATVQISDYSGEDEMILAINTLAQSYDTVLLPVTDSDGQLLYQSPALCELSRMPVPEENAEFRLFCSAAAAVKAQNMQLCVMFTPNSAVSSLKEAALTDGTLIAELALYGADEVLITLPDNFSAINTKTAEKLCSYISDCRQISDNACSIGILLSSEFYLDESSAKQIQQIASTASFLGINFRAEGDSTAGSAYRYVSRSITYLLGSFNVYNMRMILEGTPELLSQQYKACQDGGISNICFASYVMPYDLDYRSQTSDESVETDLPSRETAPVNNTNPYASGSKENETAADVDNFAESNEDVESESPDAEKLWY